jgi:hypothetical protein
MMSRQGDPGLGGGARGTPALSGALSLSAAVGKTVIASDEGPVEQRLREDNRGWLFPCGSTEGLEKCIDSAAL